MDEWSSFAVKRLGDGRHPDDIILEICQESGMSWKEAEALVEEARNTFQPAITRRQALLQAILAFGVLAGGLAIAIYELTILVDVVLEYLDNLSGSVAVFAILYYLITAAPVAWGTLALAIAMMLGGIIGLARVWEAILFYKSS